MVGSVPDGRRGDGTAGTNPSGATGNPAIADRVSAAAAELYGTDPQQFTDRRKALAAAARDAGEADAAKRIAGLRKPTRAAWVVNTLTRADPDAPARLGGLAADLRAAEQARDGPRLRELSAERGALIDALTGQALTVAGVPDPPAGLRDEVAATLTAALADPEVAAEFATGTLTRAAQWAGFGLALPAGGPDTAAGPGTAVAGTAAPAPVIPRAKSRDEGASAEVAPLQEARRRRDRLAAGRGPADRRAAGSGPAAGHPAQREVSRGADEDRQRQRRAEQDQRRQLQAEQDRRRLAEEAAQAAARRRQIFDDAERSVASATAATADAVAVEDQLEREVRDLEERLTRARAELAGARMRARRAEAAERKARQALDRLPRPDDGP
jgi:hypothetical protein